MPWPDDPGSPPESSQRSVLRASPAKSPRFLRIGFVSVKALADCNKPFSRLYQHLGVYGHPYGLQDSLCTLRLFCSQKKNAFSYSATGATLDTGGRLSLTRQGLAPCKMRQALLGALTPRITGRAVLAVLCEAACYALPIPL